METVLAAAPTTPAMIRSFIEEDAENAFEQLMVLFLASDSMTNLSDSSKALVSLPQVSYADMPRVMFGNRSGLLLISSIAKIAA